MLSAVGRLRSWSPGAPGCVPEQEFGNEDKKSNVDYRQAWYEILMIRLRFVILFLLLLIPSLTQAAEPPKGVRPIRVLLLGDSKCIGSICRIVAPQADHLEQVMEKLLAAEKDLPPVKVINQGRDGEYIRGLLSGRYDRDIAPIKDIDFVLVRYGPNDRHRLKDFAKELPRDNRDLIDRLRKDYPHAEIVMMTMLPLMGVKGDNEVNDVVRSVAAERKLPLCDIHARYAAERKFGPHMLQYRRIPFKEVPVRYRSLFAGTLVGESVVVLDNRMDAHMRGVPGWFRDQHPNLAGYHVIGDETAKFLAPLIRERMKTR
jgi:lysophospholipase L1-like esterase